ncbi:MAG: hypothetical protein MJB12_00255, partial [Firmicutes bacterium]|nr:hypothetical protein [Bacillota bacterium]
TVPATDDRYFLRARRSSDGKWSPAVTVFTGEQDDLRTGSISGSQAICHGGVPATITSSVPAYHGTAPYYYQWQYSTNGSGYHNIPGATGTSYSPGPLTSARYYRRKVTDACGDSGYSGVVTVTVRPSLSGGGISGTQTCCYDDEPNTITNTAPASGGSGDYTYQWQYSLNGGSFSNLKWANGTSYSPGRLASDRYYRRKVTDNVCGDIKYSNTVKVTVPPVMSPGSICCNQTTCGGAATLVSKYRASGGSGVYLYKWQYSYDNITFYSAPGNRNGTSYTVLPASTRYYRRKVTDLTCGDVKYSNSILITVRDKLSPGGISGAQTICEGGTAGRISNSAPPSGGDGSYTYRWQTSPDDSNWSTAPGDYNNPYYDPGTLASTKYFRRRVYSCGQYKYTGSVKITVNPDNLQAGTVSTSSTGITAGQPVTL